MNSILYNGQSILDKAIENTGDVENAFDLALLNQISLTDTLKTGTSIKLSPITNSKVVDFFNDYNKPATALSNMDLEQIENLGIGEMIIEKNFNVA